MKVLLHAAHKVLISNRRRGQKAFSSSSHSSIDGGTYRLPTQGGRKCVHVLRERKKERKRVFLSFSPFGEDWLKIAFPSSTTHWERRKREKQLAISGYCTSTCSWKEMLVINLISYKQNYFLKTCANELLFTPQLQLGSKKANKKYSVGAERGKFIAASRNFTAELVLFIGKKPEEAKKEFRK